MPSNDLLTQVLDTYGTITSTPTEPTVEQPNTPVGAEPQQPPQRAPLEPLQQQPPQRVPLEPLSNTQQSVFSIPPIKARPQTSITTNAPQVSPQYNRQPLNIMQPPQKEEVSFKDVLATENDKIYNDVAFAIIPEPYRHS
jgi:hypothetical protein